MTWSRMRIESLTRLAPPALFSLIFFAGCTMGERDDPSTAAVPQTAEVGAPASRSAAADDAICNAPASTVLMPIPAAGGPTVPINVKVHYNRPDGQYAGWGLHVWQINDASQFIGDYPGVTFPEPLAPAGFDDFGPFFQIEAAKLTNPQAAGFGFIVHQGDNKDPDGDRFWMFSGGAEIWLRSGDATIYLGPLGPPAGTNTTSTVDARAVWLTRARLRWPRVDGTGEFRLYHSATGQIAARAGQPITGADGALPLTVFTGELPPAVAERFKFVGAGVTLALASTDSSPALDAVLTSQLVVVQQDASGNVLGATTAQLPGKGLDVVAINPNSPDGLSVVELG
ncbi:MAG TPA: pullulanase-associated domain-containing protein, partial [Kofleriaceae bacterium]|nr:pullulanase-associated domain-containing protein [Kofleriaceae bacterium]